MEVVLLQAGVLMEGVLAGLTTFATQHSTRAAFGGQFAISRAVVDALSAQASAVKDTFTVQLRLAIYNSGSSGFAPQPLVRFEDLSLLDTQQIDASIEFAMAQHEVTNAVDDVLPALNALISSLLGWITVQPQLNPLRPDAFVKALQACLAQHVPDEAARAAMMPPAAGILGADLRLLYREICDWLRTQGVEPARPLGNYAGVTAESHGVGFDNSVERSQMTLDKLRKLLSGELDGPFDGLEMPDFSHTIPASFMALEDLKLVEPMMKRLAQRAPVPTSMSASLVDASQQMVHEQTQRKQLGLQLGEEVVRMMLENLMQDERLMPRVRELIGRLGPVLLSLSHSDPRFFSERQHPARQFLERITHRSLGYASDVDEGFLRFASSISVAVDVLAQEDHDSASFVRVLAGLESGWSRDEAAQRQHHEEAVRTLLHVEQRNLLAQRLADDLHDRLSHKEVPELVAVFLRGPWSQVLAESQLSCIDGSADPGGYLACVDDLIWSVQLRQARRNRARLVQLVPTLLMNLRQGLQLIQYPEERIRAFFDALIALHERVFEGPRQQAAPELDLGLVSPPAEVAASDIAMEESTLPDARDFWVGQVEAQDSAYLPEDSISLGSATPQMVSVSDLRVSAWIELIVDDAWLRAQLTWASPHGRLFMFVSRGGLAHSMSRRTLDRLHRQGRVRFVSDGHLIDNALDAVAQTALKNDLGQSKSSA